MNTTRSYYRGWHDVAVFEDFNDGQVLARFLKDEGFEVRTHDDKWFRYFLFLRPPRITHRVQVREPDFNEAANRLQAKMPVILEKAMHCPACASLRVSYPQMTRRFILPTVLLHLGIIFRIIDHQCYCEHCHAVWYLPKQNINNASQPAAKPLGP
jgi:hypothetical protein